jgi:hypothetical protein
MKMVQKRSRPRFYSQAAESDTEAWNCTDSPETRAQKSRRRPRRLLVWQHRAREEEADGDGPHVSLIKQKKRLDKEWAARRESVSGLEMQFAAHEQFQVFIFFLFLLEFPFLFSFHF